MTVSCEAIHDSVCSTEFLANLFSKRLEPVEVTTNYPDDQVTMR